MASIVNGPELSKDLRKIRRCHVPSGVSSVALCDFAHAQ